MNTVKKSASLVEIALPFFPGFYESELSYLIDRSVESLFDYDGSGSSSVPDGFWDEVCYSATCEAIARLWLSAYQDWLLCEHDLSVSLQWTLITSPKEYNFQTDRVFALCSLSDVAKVYRIAGSKAVRASASERFTSRSGFISFYSPDVSSWGKLSTWDHNQLGTVFHALGQPSEYLMDCADSNGHIDNALVLTEKGREMANQYYEDHKALEEWNNLCKA